MRIAANSSNQAAHLLLSALRDVSTTLNYSVEDWELLIRAARRTKLLAHLGERLEKSDGHDQLTEKVKRHLDSARNLARHRQTQVSWELNRVLWGINDPSIPIIVLKGAAYVVANLPPAAGRHFADLDLLVPEKSLDTVESSLLRKGWAKMQLDPYDEKYYRQWMHEIPPLRHRERETEIDIHHNILPRTSRLNPSARKLLEGAVRLEEPGVFVLSPHDMVLHSVTHLFMEGDPEEGLRLRDLVDASELMTHFGKEQTFWEGLIPRACELDLQRPLYYGIRYAQRLLGLYIPGDVLNAVSQHGPMPPIRHLMDVLAPLALMPQHPDFPNRRGRIARWLLYIRAHWLRMPPLLLLGHLTRKGLNKRHGAKHSTQLTALDLKKP